eukprot:13785695-Alexandrium_andersonii.AAC.1
MAPCAQSGLGEGRGGREAWRAGTTNTFAEALAGHRKARPRSCAAPPVGLEAAGWLVGGGGSWRRPLSWAFHRDSANTWVDV